MFAWCGPSPLIPFLYLCPEFKSGQMNYLSLFNAVPPLRDALPPSLASALAHQAELTELKPGQPLLQMKLNMPRVAFLANGFAAYSIDAAEAITNVLPAAAWVALSFCLNPNSQPPSIWALSHATIVTLPREELLRAAYASPQLALALTLSAADDARMAYAHLAALRTRSAEGRCAYVLLDLAERIYASSSFECALDQSMLASLAGLSRGAFSRALKALAAKGFISCERNSYRILEGKGLKNVK